nr:MAG TPA: hypothetical protein [Caudoviricetes sp.]
MDSETKTNLTSVLRVMSSSYGNAEPEKRETMRKEMLDINNMILNDDKFEEEKRKSLKAESLREKEVSLREKEVSKSAEDDKKAKRDRFIDLGLKVAGIVIPASLYFAGMIMSMKLEYVDNGRTPGAFKDFIKKF